jgi:rRNA small subunit aminocarboxypropyltransferase
MKPQVYMMRQDDPFKCTAAKLAKFRIVESVKFIRKDAIVLSPFSKILLTRNDSQVARYVCAVDCSWEKAEDVARHKRVFSAGISRILPAMLAANPINYAKLGKLSSAEALAGALYILGEKQTAIDITNKFKWGHTFLDLNANLLEDYSKAQTQEQIMDLEQEYFPNLK